jgi:hypothetical protein
MLTKFKLGKTLHKTKSKRFITKEDLPSILRNSDLQPYELKDFLCHMASGKSNRC